MSNNPYETKQVATKEFAEIPLSLIDDPQRPMRSDMTRENIDDLVRSIKQIGIIEPVIVRPAGDRYEVIAGHRRTAAAEFAGLNVLPCHIVDVDDDQAEMMKIHENLYRVDISPGDEGRHYAYLIEKQKLTPTRVAQLINRSPQYVTDRLDILDYDPQLREALDKKLISFSVAKEFHKIKELSKLRQYLSYAIRGGMSAGVAKKWVDDLLKPKLIKDEFKLNTLDDGMYTSAQEQSSKCFYCMQEVKLLEAHVVYVHPQCVDERTQILPETNTDPNA